MADAADVEKIKDMGFSEAAAHRALRQTSGDVARSVEWLFEHAGDPDLNTPLPPEPDLAAGPPPLADAVAPPPADGFDELLGSGDDDDDDDPFALGFDGEPPPAAAGGGGAGAPGEGGPLPGDSPAVLQLVEFGFSVNAAKKGLHFCRGNTEQALEWILMRSGDPTLDDEFDPNVDPTDALVAMSACTSATHE